MNIYVYRLKCFTNYSHISICQALSFVLKDIQIQLENKKNPDPLDPLLIDKMKVEKRRSIEAENLIV